MRHPRRPVLLGCLASLSVSVFLASILLIFLFHFSSNLWWILKASQWLKHFLIPRWWLFSLLSLAGLLLIWLGFCFLSKIYLSLCISFFLCLWKSWSRQHNGIVSCHLPKWLLYKEKKDMFYVLCRISVNNGHLVISYPSCLLENFIF